MNMNTRTLHRHTDTALYFTRYKLFIAIYKAIIMAVNCQLYQYLAHLLLCKVFLAAIAAL